MLLVGQIMFKRPCRPAAPVEWEWKRIGSLWAEEQGAVAEVRLRGWRFGLMSCKPVTEGAYIEGELVHRYDVDGKKKVQYCGLIGSHAGEDDSRVHWMTLEIMPICDMSDGLTLEVK